MKKYIGDFSAERLGSVKTKLVREFSRSVVRCAADFLLDGHPRAWKPSAPMDLRLSVFNNPCSFRTGDKVRVNGITKSAFTVTATDLESARIRIRGNRVYGWLHMTDVVRV